MLQQLRKKSTIFIEKSKKGRLDFYKFRISNAFNATLKEFS